MFKAKKGHSVYLFSRFKDCPYLILQVAGAMIDGVLLRVSMARRQPTFDSNSNEPSTASWSTIGNINYGVIV